MTIEHMIFARMAQQFVNGRRRNGEHKSSRYSTYRWMSLANFFKRSRLFRQRTCACFEYSVFQRLIRPHLLSHDDLKDPEFHVEIY